MIEDTAEIERLKHVIERAISALEKAELDAAMQILTQTEQKETAAELLHIFANV